MVMQQMSLKIFQRREQLINDLKDRQLIYHDETGARVGRLESFSDGVAFIRDGTRLVQVSVNRLELP